MRNAGARLSGVVNRHLLKHVVQRKSNCCGSYGDYLLKYSLSPRDAIKLYMAKLMSVLVIRALAQSYSISYQANIAIRVHLKGSMHVFHSCSQSPNPVH